MATVPLCDDEEILRSPVRAALQKDGCELVGATGGNECDAAAARRAGAGPLLPQPFSPAAPAELVRGILARSR